MPLARSRTSAGILCNDTRDTDRYELLLIRAGQHLWKLLKRGKTVSLREREAIEAALETVWEAKRKYRVELKARLAEAGAEFAARMRKKEAQ